MYVIQPASIGRRLFYLKGELVVGQHNFLLKLFELTSQSFHRLVCSCFKGIVLVFGKKLFPGHIQFNLNELVLILLVFI